VGFNRAGGEVGCESEGCGESGALTDGGHGLGVAAVDAAANFVLAGPPRQSGGTNQTPGQGDWLNQPLFKAPQCFSTFG